MSETQKAYERDKVIQIIGSVIEKVEQDTTFPKEVVTEKLTELHGIIDTARNEIAMMRPKDIGGKDIPTATDELDAITDATGEATAGIMDACEEINKIADTVDGAQKDQIIDQVTKVYEHCTFHDLTTQRINKIVNTLKKIEDRVDGLMNAIGDKLPVVEDSDEGDEGKDPLLNGPQLPSNAVSQEDIDKLLDSFD